MKNQLWDLSQSKREEYFGWIKIKGYSLHINTCLRRHRNSPPPENQWEPLKKYYLVFRKIRFYPANRYLSVDSRTSTTTITRFDVKFFRVFNFKIKSSRKASFYHFSLEKLALLSLVKEVTPSPDRKMIKLLTFDDLFPPTSTR